MAQTGTSPATQPDRQSATQNSQAKKSDTEKKHKNTAMNDSQSPRSSYGAQSDTSTGMASQTQDQQRSSSGLSSSQSQQRSSTGMSSQQGDSSGLYSQNQQRSGLSSQSRSTFGMSSSQQGVAKVEAEQKNQILSSSDLVGADIKDQHDNKVGTISDLHLSQDGRIEAVHVDIGGVLGIGSTTYRLPFDGLQVSQDGEDVTVQIQQETLQELAQLSPELQDEMEGWDTTEQQVTASTQTSTQGFGQSMRNMGNQAEQTTRNAAGAVGTQMSETGRDLQSFGEGGQDSRQLVDRIRNELDSDSPALQDITNVQVQMQQDRLILQGQVQTEQSKQDIVDAAESVAEGREVVDNLQVGRSGAVGAAF